jgi:hypothetical protein
LAGVPAKQAKKAIMVGGIYLEFDIVLDMEFLALMLNLRLGVDRSPAIMKAV